MLTSLLSDEIEATSLRLGASNVLVKPCSSSSLETLVGIALLEDQDAEGAGIGRVKGAPEDARMEPPADHDYQAEDVLAKYSGEPGKLISTGRRLTK